MSGAARSRTGSRWEEAQRQGTMGGSLRQGEGPGGGKEGDAESRAEGSSPWEGASSRARLSPSGATARVCGRQTRTHTQTHRIPHPCCCPDKAAQTHTLACAHMPAPHTQAPHAYTSATSSLWTRAHRDRCCSLPHSLPMYVGSVHRYKHTGIAALSALHTVQTETHVDAETRAHQQTCGLRSAHVCSCFRLGGSAHALAHECKA